MVIFANGKFYITTEHFEAELLDDRVSVADVINVLENAEPVPSRKNPERDAYIHKNICVIVNETTEQIVTVYRIKKS